MISAQGLLHVCKWNLMLNSGNIQGAQDLLALRLFPDLLLRWTETITNNQWHSGMLDRKKHIDSESVRVWRGVFGTWSIKISIHPLY